MIKVNGWKFDFKLMRATKWNGRGLDGVQIMNIDYFDGFILKRPASANHSWSVFFTHEEKHYNNDVLRAYIDYTFEQDILIDKGKY
jgi:hypothetical protein